MKPPIFGIVPTGTKQQQYLHRAKMFSDAAMGLPDYVNGETNWPAYALMLHACELALKAFCDQSVANGKPSTRAPNHDLQGWYNLALQYGLAADPHIADGVDILSEIHKSHYTRYPDTKNIRPRDLSVVNDVVEALMSAAGALIHPR